MEIYHLSGDQPHTSINCTQGPQLQLQKLQSTVKKKNKKKILGHLNIVGIIFKF